MKPVEHSCRRAVLASAVAMIALGASQAWSTSTTVGSDFIETVNPNNCANEGSCKVKFTAVGSNSEKLVTNVSCQIQALQASAIVLQSTLGQGTGGTPLTYLIPVLIYTSSAQNSRYFKINHSVYHAFASGQTPQIFVSVSGTNTLGSVICTIAGVIKSVVT
jgi:hypothetical protein